MVNAAVDAAVDAVAKERPCTDTDHGAGAGAGTGTVTGTDATHPSDARSAM